MRVPIVRRRARPETARPDRLPSLPLASRVALLAGIALVAIAPLLPVACTRSDSPGPVRDDPLVADQEIENFSVTESQEGKREWTLYAKVARIYEKIGETRADSVRVEFFRETDGALYSTLRADAGRIDQGSKDMTASGNVVVETIEGYRLTTNSLTWVERSGKIRTDDAIRLEKGKDVLTGVGFESDPSLREYVIRSDVKAHVANPDARPGENP